LTSTALALPTAVVVTVIGVFAALAGMQGVYVRENVTPAAVDVNWYVMELPISPATTTGPTAAVPPIADTSNPHK
jgi:hypothetical protein